VIELDILKQSTSEKRSIQSGYLYNDIELDLSLSRFTKDELYAEAQPKDLAEVQDAQAIYNAVLNILTTAPGEKLLNPTFGLDLRTYLFEPINTTTSYFIATDIFHNIGAQEPRVLLEAVSVTGEADEGEYIVDILFSIPTLDIYNLNLKATLNRDGYVVI
jgi:phage baseplate assembly protein W